MTDIPVLKLLLKRTNYNQYQGLVGSVKAEPEVTKLLHLISLYYETYQHHDYISVDELQTFFHVTFPSLRSQTVFSTIFDKLRAIEVSDSLATEIVLRFVEKDVAGSILELITPVLNGEGKDALLQIPEVLTDYKNKIGIMEEVSPYVEDGIGELLNLIDKQHGLQWGLKVCNENLGPLTGGTLGHIYADVNIGKTTFIVSQIGHMSKQLLEGETVLHVCNEEGGNRVKLRYYQYFLGMSSEEILQTIRERGRAAIDNAFREAGGVKIRLFYDTGATVEGVRSLLEKQPARLLCIDVADHLGFRGADDLTGPARLETLYRKFRGMASQYNCDVFTVAQASHDVSGRKVVHLGDMYNSKTGKPGALDWAIGIGSTYDESEAMFRWLNFTKSKISSIQKVTNMIRIDKDRGQMYDV